MELARLAYSGFTVGARQEPFTFWGRVTSDGSHLKCLDFMIFQLYNYVKVIHLH